MSTDVVDLEMEPDLVTDRAGIRRVAQDLGPERLPLGRPVPAPQRIVRAGVLEHDGMGGTAAAHGEH